MGEEDKDVLDHINELAHEEHGLFEKESRGEATAADQERLTAVGVKLDQCWDLLHQRRARRSAGMDPEKADVRDERTVEGYVN
ncbi:MAG: DUF2630 family protein [Actinomycetota bacterium]